MSSPQHDVHDVHNEHHEDEHAVGDADMEDYGVKDDESVDMHDFSFLVTRTADLEKQVTPMTESLFKMYDLLKTLEEAIKSAHIFFYDMLDKKSTFIVKSPKEDNPKKPKEAKGPILRSLKRQKGRATHKLRAYEST